MREVGIDLSTGVTAKLTDELAAGVDHARHDGLRRSVPRRAWAERDDWPLEDPKGQSLDRVREIRDEVRDRVAALLWREGWSDGTRPAR